MDVERLRNRFLEHLMAVDAPEVGLTGFWLCFLFVYFLLGLVQVGLECRWLWEV